MPAKAGIRGVRYWREELLFVLGADLWIPACSGMTKEEWSKEI
jgi:hypothetical protein